MLGTRQHKVGGLLLGIVVAGIGVALIAGVWMSRQRILDQISVWEYHPTSTISSFADRSGMSQEGRFLFYTAHPSLQNAANFNHDCGTTTEQSIAILGCYTGQYIYIYNVTNAQLDGIREVTAAYEMLHVAYARMSNTDRQRIDGLLESEYQTVKNDSSISAQVAFFARAEPGERDDELYSVIATEVPTISPELEANYKLYFSDRSKVIALHAQYAAVFTNIQNQEKQLSTQLSQLSTTVNDDTTEYNQEVSQLNTDITAFNTKAATGGFSVNSEFQAERSALVSRASQLNNLRSVITGDIDLYNSLKAQLQAVSNQSDVLNKSINSNLAPAPSV